MMTSGWQLKVLAGPDVEPVTAAQAKANSNIDADIDAFDDDFDSWIKTSRELAEAYTHRSFVERTYLLSLTGFPSRCSPNWDALALVLPQGPVLQVLQVTYVEASGLRLTLDALAYQLVEDDPPRLLPAWNTSWPAARLLPGAVTVEYRAGYASAGSPTDAATVPECAKQAIKLLVSHWFENREASIPGTIGEVPFGFYTCLDAIRGYP